MRLQKLDQARVADIEDRLGQLDLARPQVLEQIMPAVGELLGTEKTIASVIKHRGDRLVYERIWSREVGHGAALRATHQIMSERPRAWSTYDVYTPAPDERNIAVDSARKNGWEKIFATPYYQRVMAPYGLAHHDQLRVLVCEERTLLAFVGVWRHGGLFTDRERRLLQRITPAFRRRLVVEHQLLQGPELRAGLDAALDAIAGEAYLVGRSGEVREANAAAKAALERDGRGTREALLAALKGRGRGFWTTRLSVGGALLVRPVSNPREARVREAARRRQLTPRQTEVLGQLALGKSNKEIAAALGCSPETVEIHMRALCEKFECESRAGILARLLEL